MKKLLSSSPGINDPYEDWKRKGERGIALFIALSLITIFSLLAGGFVSLGVRNTQIESDFQYSSSALSSSEAGVHFTLGQMLAREIIPPEPLLGDTVWTKWVYSFNTPGYGSEVKISYVKDLMLPYFDALTGKIREENKYFRITSKGFEARETQKKIEVITSPDKQIIFRINYAMQVGSTAGFNGNPVTFSGSDETLSVRLTGGNNLPYMDSNKNGIYDPATEWGWTQALGGPYTLDRILLNDPSPDSSAFSPPCPGLHSRGDIHSNGNLHFVGNPHINGKGSATGIVTQSGFTPFVNDTHHYIRLGYENNADSVAVGDIPTKLAYWQERATRDTSIHIITQANVGSYPGWQFSGNKFKWSGNNPMPKRTYYLTRDVLISGNPRGNATIITDDDITVDGNPSSISAQDYMGYIAGEDITIAGGQYIQGFLYSKGDINLPGESYIFGAIVIKGGGTINGNPIIVFNTSLKDKEWKFQDYRHDILSWQDVNMMKEQYADTP